MQKSPFVLLLTVHLINNDKVPAMMVHLTARDSETQELLLPVIYSDNYFFLMPGESKTVKVSVKVADCHGHKPEMQYAYLNTENAESSKDSAFSVSDCAKLVGLLNRMSSFRYRFSVGFLVRILSAVPIASRQTKMSYNKWTSAIASVME